MLLLVDNKTLRVLGRIDHSLLKKFLHDDVKIEENSDYFFIDYSTIDFNLSYTFDLFSFSDTINIGCTITISKVYDSFGNFLTEGIPQGFKTICYLTFFPKVPQSFRNLPILKGWEINNYSISLINSKDISSNEIANILEDLLILIYDDFKNISSSTVNRISKRELIKHITDKYHIRDSNEIISIMTRKGLIREDENNKIEFFRK